MKAPIPKPLGLFTRQPPSVSQPTLEEVAAKIVTDVEAVEAVEAVLWTLRHWGAALNSRLKGAGVIGEREDRELVVAVERLQKRLAFEAQVYEGVEALFGLALLQETLNQLQPEEAEEEEAA
jgi:hypothetical protein